MKTKKFEVQTYYEAVECASCGGVYNERVGEVAYMTDPIQADFKCNKCESMIRLLEPQFPNVRHRVTDKECNQ